MVHLGVTKFSTHENFPHTVYRCLHVLKFGLATFCYGSFSLLAVPLVHQVPVHVRAEEVNREVKKAEALPKENGPSSYLSFNVE